MSCQYKIITASRKACGIFNQRPEQENIEVRAWIYMAALKGRHSLRGAPESQSMGMVIDSIS